MQALTCSESVICKDNFWISHPGDSWVHENECIYFQVLLKYERPTDFIISIYMTLWTNIALHFLTKYLVHQAHCGARVLVIVALHFFIAFLSHMSWPESREMCMLRCVCVIYVSVQAWIDRKGGCSFVIHFIKELKRSSHI